MRPPKPRPEWADSVKRLKPTNLVNSLFQDFIGEKLERVHSLPVGLGDYKSITLNFANGRCLTFEVELHSSKDGIHPAMRMLKGKWELVEAAPEGLPETKQDIPMPEAKKPREVGTPDLMQLDGANQIEEFALDEGDVCPISGEPDCSSCDHAPICDRDTEYWKGEEFKERK